MNYREQMFQNAKDLKVYCHQRNSCRDCLFELPPEPENPYATGDCKINYPGDWDLTLWEVDEHEL